MDAAQLALFALLIGVVLGVSVALVVAAAYRARDRAMQRASAGIPAGIRTVLAGMDDPAVVVDRSGIVVVASPPAGDAGLREGRALPDEQLALLARAARAGTASTPVIVPMRTTGQPRTVAVHARALTPRLVLLVLHDVTEQERVAKMRRDFVANTSHELKTPAGAVSLLGEAIESAADDPDEVRGFARRLRAEAERLGTLTSRIMTLSQLEADEPLAMRDVPVDELIDDVIEAHGAQADAADVALARGGDSGALVHGDPLLLAEALGNLVANAVAYSPPGSRVGVGVKTVARVVEISVADQGIGIAESDQERVFERFFRADRARSRRTGGTGLGLAIVKHAVQRHGGEVRLWSRLGQGSTFTIRLPRAVPDAADKAALRHPGKKSPNKKHHRRKDSVA
ncbi:two-component sensor histidine kinase [Microbacterium protaetiae]|uniref:Sensor-like histidine kinase SenX3 n=1 Tax=Microbacterium protaetiae TaxID=2509458 RepID=A0A4V0YCX8_9MICO|nr:ATP-binding protein [Microbacterium protaetiae]QAY58761.1 two-component sensor histidine kinase [Microbacterium protaetiae]